MLWKIIVRIPCQIKKCICVQVHELDRLVCMAAMCHSYISLLLRKEHVENFKSAYFSHGFYLIYSILLIYKEYVWERTIIHRKYLILSNYSNLTIFHFCVIIMPVARCCRLKIYIYLLRF